MRDMEKAHHVHSKWAEISGQEIASVERGAKSLSLLLELGALYEERRQYEPAIEALGRVVVQEPTHEGAYVELMRLHALSGRRREAVSQYEEFREALFKDLGTEPEAATKRLQQEIWADTFPHLSDSPPADFPTRDEEASSGVGSVRAATRRHNLPLARTSFVGREREMLEVKRLLAMTRLLTLTGRAGQARHAWRSRWQGTSLEPTRRGCGS
jgi:tetratricopeptide (TPR) repeat protein